MATRPTIYRNWSIVKQRQKSNEPSIAEGLLTAVEIKFDFILSYRSLKNNRQNIYFTPCQGFYPINLLSTLRVEFVEFDGVFREKQFTMFLSVDQQLIHSVLYQLA